ncbi:Extracellular solute-binding protein, family 3 [Desulfonema limicola]|uniref:Extracellular solute-binding protein, family 3 n=1 Tax=Desulfonema limicola TaxID=45656 RepID=A0A975BDV3_9BACT|nr:transporter substrate-binding domain-containing protein [Desulfonema limicola]QTA83528.1 Extracellular solute-binding protein, family 3 [Desulfonema limicola]
MQKNFQKKFVCLAALITVFLFTNVYAETILVYGNVDKPPKQWTEKDGTLKGIWIDIMKAVNSEVKDIQFKIDLQPWKRAYKGGTEGKNALMGLFYNEERGKIFEYSDPVLEEQVVIAVKKGNEFKFENLEDLKGKTIGIYATTSYGIDWEKAVDSGVINVQEDYDNAQRLVRIAAGKLDGGVFNPGAAAVKMFCRQKEELDFNMFSILENPVLSRNSYFVIAKSLNRKDIIEKFNNGLKAVKASGKYQEIIDSYLK